MNRRHIKIAYLLTAPEPAQGIVAEIYALYRAPSSAGCHRSYLCSDNYGGITEHNSRYAQKLSEAKCDATGFGKQLLMYLSSNGIASLGWLAFIEVRPNNPHPQNDRP